MRKTFQSIRSFIFVYILTALLTSTAYSGEKQQMNIEGIFYLDKTPVSVVVEDGIIQKIIRKEALDNPDLSDVIIAPGFIDHQVNGCLGIDFSSEELTVEKVKEATAALWKAGVTTVFPTLTTNSKDALIHGFSTLAKAVKKDKKLHQMIPGYHLEGPYISPVDGYRGAHPKQWVRLPDWDEFMDLYKASDEKILQVSVAPEMEGAIAFIEKCSQMGIKTALAHHNANMEQVRQAADAGARVCTHLGNGCANMINRHANPLWPQLSEDRLTISIICDGFHLRREEVRTFLKVKGVERTVVTSDAGHLAGLPPGLYKGFEADLVVTEEGMISYPEQNVLAGSASFIDKGIGNIIKFTGCSVADAVHMAGRNQARLYQLHDRGVLEPGKRADIVLFTLKDHVVEVQKTYLAGKLVYDAASTE